MREFPPEACLIFPFAPKHPQRAGRDGDDCAAGSEAPRRPGGLGTTETASTALQVEPAPRRSGLPGEVEPEHRGNVNVLLRRLAGGGGRHRHRRSSRVPAHILGQRHRVLPLGRHRGSDVQSHPGGQGERRRPCRTKPCPPQPYRILLTLERDPPSHDTKELEGGGPGDRVLGEGAAGGDP